MVIKMIKICENCGEKFKVGKVFQKFCSKKCGQKYRIKRRGKMDYSKGTVWILHMTENLDEDWLWVREERPTN